MAMHALVGPGGLIEAYARAIEKAREIAERAAAGLREAGRALGEARRALKEAETGKGRIEQVVREASSTASQLLERAYKYTGLAVDELVKVKQDIANAIPMLQDVYNKLSGWVPNIGPLRLFDLYVKPLKEAIDHLVAMQREVDNALSLLSDTRSKLARAAAGLSSAQALKTAGR